jgi:SpoVK/Ycf46/Vps4 family AAA+-type ATPase
MKDIVLPESTREKLDNFTKFYKKNSYNESFIFSFHGPYGSEKVDVAYAVSREIRNSMVVIDLQALFHSNLLFELGLDLAFREHNIRPACIYFKNCDFLFDDENNAHLKKFFLDKLDDHSWLSFLDSAEPLPVHGEFSNQRLISIEFPVPGYNIRKDLWQNHLKNHKLSEDTDIREIANKYNLTAGQIKDIVATASTYALWRDSDNAVITQKDIEEACHIHSNQKLSKLAVRVKPKHVWEDLVLEAPVKNKLKDLVSMFKYKHVVYDEWGFDDKLSLGKGISALFYGEPGTGKTLAAEIIANELSMDMYKVDLAAVVSKYVGETEKNLDVIFKEAEVSNCILFFDEADALFGKRTEIKDAHDRYANVEVSYLLQKIDEFRGMVVMATNFSSNLDPAFERRLHFSIKFPFPDETSRCMIWKNIFPAKTPVAKNIDYETLAKKFLISGGNIKNIALASAFYTAESGGDNRSVTMKQIIHACKLEFDKIGRLWDNHYDEDFNNKMSN